DWAGPLVARPNGRPAGKPAAADEALPAPEELRSWGAMKIRHASPPRSLSGLEALYLMAYDHVLPPKERPKDSGEIRGAFERALAEKKGELSAWLSRCERDLPAPLRSTRLLTETMVNVGSSRYDGVVTFEHTALHFLPWVDAVGNARREARVFYMQP